MRKKRSIALTLLFMLIGTGTLFAYSFEFLTVNDVVKKVKQNFAKVDTYQADFSMVSTQKGKKSYQRGVLKYKSDGKIAVNYSSPYGQKIISDGKRMWIYIPSMNLVAEQDLKSAGGRKGIDRLFYKYHYRFATKEQPKLDKNGKKYYILYLKQKESRRGYRNLKLWINEKYFIERAEGETSSGKKVEIKFSNIKTDVDIANGIFKYTIPAKARVVKNPMLSEEE